MKNKKYIYIFLAVLVELFISTTIYFIYKNYYKKEITNTVQVKSTTASTTIIAFGDSLTAGFGLPLSESYPAQLENLLVGNGYSVRVINAGVSGETSKGNNERAQFIRDQNSDVVLLGIGGNDALRALPINELNKNIEKTIQILQSGDNPPRVILLAMQAPQNAGTEYKKSFDSIYGDIATKYKILKVDFIQSEVFLDKNLLLKDGIHPTKEGYKILVEKYVYPKVKTLIQENKF